MNTTFKCALESAALEGSYDEKFSLVVEEFERNFRERDELGASGLCND